MVIQTLKQVYDSQPLALPAPPSIPKYARLDKLVGLLLTDDGTSDLNALAKLAGYSDVTANKSIYTIVKRPAFQTRLLEAYKGATVATLPKVLQVRNKALGLYLDDPELAINKPKMLESIERVAGVLHDKPAGGLVINYGTIQQSLSQKILNTGNK